MLEKQIVFNPSPFLRMANFVPDTLYCLKNHWVTKYFGFKAFKDKNSFNRWLYFKISEDTFVKATPEFVNDTQVSRLVFSKIKI